MDSNDLEAWQLERIAVVLRRFQNYIGRLRAKMEARVFPRNDRYRQLVEGIHGELHKLMVLIHYDTCDKRRQEIDVKKSR